MARYFVDLDIESVYPLSVPRPHKIVLKELLDSLKEQLDRLEAVVGRLELVAPHSEPPTDPAALEAAERMIEDEVQRRMMEVPVDAD